MRRATEERFFAKVVAGPNNCWIWTGAVRAGYPTFTVDGPRGACTRSVGAHRWSWEYANGAIPEGLQIDHVKDRGCTSKLCVNPSHLEPVTPRENSLRYTRTIRYCPAGHEHNETNTRICKDGKRACRACERERARRKREAA